MRGYRRRHARGGVTLIEAMIAVGIILLITAAGGSLYIMSLKMYQQGVSLTMAHERAQVAIQLMRSTIRESMNVDYPGPHAVIVTVPAKDANGYNVVNPVTKSLVPGEQVAFYYADDSGFPQANGTTLWRASRPAGTASWQRIEQLTADVESLNFEYSPSLDMLELVKLELTVQAREGPNVHSQTLVEQVLIRNH
ncbi:MAG: PilW family protein [Armatimonadota bacterium]